MKLKTLSIVISILLVTGALLIPISISHAAEPIVPKCNTVLGTVIVDGVSVTKFIDECGMCQLVKLAENTVGFIVQIAFVAAALLFAVAGFMFFTGGADPGKITTARKIFTNTIIGIIIILVSWLVVNVIITVLVGEGVNPFTKVLCEGTSKTSSQTQTTGNNSSGGGITAEPVNTPNPNEYFFEVQNPDGTFDSHTFLNFEECSAAQSSATNVVFTCSGEDFGATPRSIDNPKGYTFEVRNTDGTYENFIFPTFLECVRAQSSIDPGIDQVVFSCSGINLENVD